MSDRQASGFIKPRFSHLVKATSFCDTRVSEDIHHEIEIIVKINKVGKYIEPKFAHKYYDEISVGIDFTARDGKLKSEKVYLGKETKSFDGSAVIGDFFCQKSSLVH
jgi:2-keto-4-pentenoate hydratase/2-oxohepta-3-ene-1,7-dioic acid hydratase in catechol pathway